MKGTDQACTERKSAYVRVLMYDLVLFPVIPFHLYTGERSKIEGQYLPAWQLCCLHRTQQSAQISLVQSPPISHTMVSHYSWTPSNNWMRQ